MSSNIHARSNSTTNVAPSKRQKPPTRDRIILSATEDAKRSTSAPPALSFSPSNITKTQIVSAKARQATTTFLTLPPEIRNIIYIYALYHSDNWIISSPIARITSLDKTSRNYAFAAKFVSQAVALRRAAEEQDALFVPHKRCSAKCLLQPAITRVCRFIRLESLPVFYGINTFQFDAAT